MFYISFSHYIFSHLLLSVGAHFSSPTLAPNWWGGYVAIPYYI